MDHPNLDLSEFALARHLQTSRYGWKCSGDNQLERVHLQLVEVVFPDVTEAIRGDQTLAELSAKHAIHQTMIAAWKRQAIEGLATTFSRKAEAAQVATATDVNRLHALIGQLVVERDSLAKASGPMGGDRAPRSSTGRRQPNCFVFKFFRKPLLSRHRALLASSET